MQGLAGRKDARACAQPFIRGAKSIYTMHTTPVQHTSRKACWGHSNRDNRELGRQSDARETRHLLGCLTNVCGHASSVLRHRRPVSTRPLDLSRARALSVEVPHGCPRAQ